MRFIKFLILSGLVINLISGNYLVDFTPILQDFTYQGMRRVRNPVQFPKGYQNIVDQLEYPDPEKRREAINSITDIILNREKDENVRGILALKVADKLSDADKYVRERTVDALGEIIPSLANEALKKDLALKIADKLSDEGIYWTVVDALDEILPFLSDESKEVVTLKVVDILIDHKFIHPDENVCETVVDTLVKISLSSPKIVKFLKQLRDIAEGRDREEAASFLKAEKSPFADKFLKFKEEIKPMLDKVLKEIEESDKGKEKKGGE